MGWCALALATRCSSSASVSPTSEAGADDSPSGGVVSASDGNVGAGVGSADTYFLSVIRLGCVNPGCPLCLPQVLPQDATGQTRCRIFLELAAGDSCAAHGFPAASPDNVASIDDEAGQALPGALCVLPQLPATTQVSESCTTSPAAGWCYLTGAAASHCAQTIGFSPTAVPQGAVGWLGCGQSGSTSPTSATSATSVGTTCIPSEERSPTFAGFSDREVTLDEGNSACGSDVCLVNHFQGLTSCPYGQDSTGAPPPGAQACALPDGGAAVHPDSGAAAGQTVEAWCLDRKPASSVYCSCRCQNALGRTDDGASYCACPTGYTCSQVVPAIQPGDPRAGGYCVRAGTEYSPSTSCTTGTCDPSTAPCP